MDSPPAQQSKNARNRARKKAKRAAEAEAAAVAAAAAAQSPPPSQEVKGNAAGAEAGTTTESVEQHLVQPDVEKPEVVQPSNDESEGQPDAAELAASSSGITPDKFADAFQDMPAESAADDKPSVEGSQKQQQGQASTTFDPARLRMLSHAKSQPRLVGKRRVGAARIRPRHKDGEDEDDDKPLAESTRRRTSPPSAPSASAQQGQPNQAAMTAQERESAEMRKRWKRENATMGADIASALGHTRPAYAVGSTTASASGGPRVVIVSADEHGRGLSTQEPPAGVIQQNQALFEAERFQRLGTLVEEHRQAEAMLHRVLDLKSDASARSRHHHHGLAHAGSEVQHPSSFTFSSGHLQPQQQSWQEFFMESSGSSSRSTGGAEGRFHEISTTLPTDAELRSAQSQIRPHADNDELDWYDEADEGDGEDGEEEEDDDDDAAAAADGAEYDQELASSLSVQPVEIPGANKHRRYQQPQAASLLRRAVEGSAGTPPVGLGFPAAAGTDKAEMRGRSPTVRPGALAGVGSAPSQIGRTEEPRFHPGRFDGPPSGATRERTRIYARHPHSHARPAGAGLGAIDEAHTMTRASTIPTGLLEQHMHKMQISPTAGRSALTSTAPLVVHTPSSPRGRDSAHDVGPGTSTSMAKEDKLHPRSSGMVAARGQKRRRRDEGPAGGGRGERAPAKDVVYGDDEADFESEDEVDEQSEGGDVRTSPTITPATRSRYYQPHGARHLGQRQEHAARVTAWQRHGFMPASQLNDQLERQQQQRETSFEASSAPVGTGQHDLELGLQQLHVGRRPDSPAPTSFADVVAHAMAQQSARAWSEAERVRAQAEGAEETLEEEDDVDGGGMEEGDESYNSSNFESQGYDEPDLFLGAEGEEILRQVAAQGQALPASAFAHAPAQHRHAATRRRRRPRGDSVPGVLVESDAVYDDVFEDDETEGSLDQDDRLHAAAGYHGPSLDSVAFSGRRRRSESDVDALKRWHMKLEQHAQAQALETGAHGGGGGGRVCPLMREGGGWHFLDSESLHAAAASVYAEHAAGRGVFGSGGAGADGHLDRAAALTEAANQMHTEGVLCMPFERLPFRNTDELNQVLQEGRLMPVGVSIDAQGHPHQIVAWRITEAELVRLLEMELAGEAGAEIDAELVRAVEAERRRRLYAAHAGQLGEGQLSQGSAGVARVHGMVSASTGESLSGPSSPESVRQNLPAAQTSGQQATTRAKSKEARRGQQSSALPVRPRCINCAGRHEHDVAKCSDERHVMTDRPTAVRRSWQPPNVANPSNKADARWDSHLVFRDTGSVVCTHFNGPTPPGCVAPRKLRRSQKKVAPVSKAEDAGLMCPHGGVHRCSGCGQPGHGMQACPETHT